MDKIMQDQNIGNKYGSLTCDEFIEMTKQGKIYSFICDCGKKHIARMNTIKYQAKKYLAKNDIEIPSCGCIELSRKTKHGFRTVKNTHPCYRIYRGIMSRCYLLTDPNYKYYGAKGVTICDEWKDNPEAFVKWCINNGYKKGLVIDKDILSDKLNIHPHIYSPQTCQFIDAKTNVAYATNRNNYGKHTNIRLSQAQVDEIIRLHNTGEFTVKKLTEMFNLKQTNSIYRLLKLHNSKVSVTN